MGRRHARRGGHGRSHRPSRATARFDRVAPPKEATAEDPRRGAGKGAATRKRTTTERKAELVAEAKRLVGDGSTSAEAAEELGVPRGNLSKWWKLDRGQKFGRAPFREKKVVQSAVSPATVFGEDFAKVEREVLAKSKKLLAKKWLPYT